MLYGVCPEILHFVQDDERRVQHDKGLFYGPCVAVTLSSAKGLKTNERQEHYET